MANKFRIASRASVMVGGSQILGFNGATTEEIIAGELYDPTVDDIVSMYRWRCMTMQFTLSRIAAAPLARYEAAYQLPAETQLINAVTIDDVPIEFDRYQDKIYCNADVGEVVVADITYRADEAFWPGYFETLVRLKLASAFAVPIAEDTQKAAFYEGQFIRKLGAAKTNDAQGRTARKLPVGGLRRYHGGQP